MLEAGSLLRIVVRHGIVLGWQCKIGEHRQLINGPIECGERIDPEKQKNPVLSTFY